jgi:hypothetical protein
VEKRYEHAFRCRLTKVFKRDSGAVYVSGIEHGTDAYEKGKETVAVEETVLSPNEISASNVPVSSAKVGQTEVQRSEEDEIVSVEKMV